ncbi:hypothetical protein [Denitromonas iodatirespirans]|uniref:Uncharacterized protein n=1 Tax=Denitromonas iodatirespirans TaxID=2795389 RepID=A0A944D961_DENI1|nr:hypothetical protein [Denitromonas iodatirespirans]MBT0960313.1 hypothetical protein [Denitromonas iodatirespirans]
MLDNATSIACGYTDLCACWDDAAAEPCTWLMVDRETGLGVCSACPEALTRWQAGDLSVAVPADPNLGE